MVDLPYFTLPYLCVFISGERTMTMKILCVMLLGFFCLTLDAGSPCTKKKLYESCTENRQCCPDFTCRRVQGRKQCRYPPPYGTVDHHGDAIEDLVRDLVEDEW